jgi:hypothetical protein
LKGGFPNCTLSVLGDAPPQQGMTAHYFIVKFQRKNFSGSVLAKGAALHRSTFYLLFCANGCNILRFVFVALYFRRSIFHCILLFALLVFVDYSILLSIYQCR